MLWDQGAAEWQQVLPAAEGLARGFWPDRCCLLLVCCLATRHRRRANNDNNNSGKINNNKSNTKSATAIELSSIH